MGGNRRRGAFSSDSWLAALIAASLVVVAIPSLAFRTPPLLDYPNHYARLWLLADGLALEPTAGMYAADFSRAWTNIGVDLVAWLLGPLTSARVLGPLFVTAAVLGPPLGALLLHRRLYGGVRWWQAVIAATAWTATLIAGFLNYQIGLGLALAAAAADGWIDRRGAAAKLALRLVIGVGLIATHIFAVFFYVLLMGALALGPDLRVLMRRREWPGLLQRLLMGVGPPLAALALFWLAAPTRPAGPMVFIDWSPDSGLYLLFSSIGTYDIAVDRAFMAVPALLALAALVVGKLRMHGGLLLAALSVAILSQVTPAAAGGAFWVNQRLPIMALLIVISAIDPQIGRRAPIAIALASVGLAVVAGRTAFVADVWRHRQADYRALERALEPVPPGATILTLEHDPTNAENLRMPPGRWFYGGVAHWNDAALAVPWRRAFVPFLFTNPGQQPVRVLPPWTSTSAPGSPPANVHALDGAGSGVWRGIAGYAACWRTHYDYALITNADMPDADGPVRLPRELTLVRDEGYARLYRIARRGPPGPNPAPCPWPAPG